MPPAALNYAGMEASYRASLPEAAAAAVLGSLRHSRRHHTRGGIHSSA